MNKICASTEDQNAKPPPLGGHTLSAGHHIKGVRDKVITVCINHSREVGLKHFLESKGCISIYMLLFVTNISLSLCCKEYLEVTVHI